MESKTHDGIIKIQMAVSELVKAKQRCNLLNAISDRLSAHARNANKEATLAANEVWRLDGELQKVINRVHSLNSEDFTDSRLAALRSRDEG